MSSLFVRRAFLGLFSFLSILALVLLATTAHAQAAGQDALVARGDYIVNVVAQCNGCHTPRVMGQLDTSRKLGGYDCFLRGKRPDYSMPTAEPPADAGAGPWCGANGCEPDYTRYGCLSSRNLTNHESGLKNYTDAQIADMLQKGLQPNGEYLSPVMPYRVYSKFTDDDIKAIIAYLRTLPGVDHIVTRSEWPWVPVARPEPVEMDNVWKPAPGAPNYDALMRGRYLATVSCMACHSPWKGRIETATLDEKKLFAGTGIPWIHELNQLPTPPFPWRIYSHNLTQDETGLKGYTKDDILKVFRYGVAKDGTSVCAPMPTGKHHGYGLGFLDPQDMEAIADYILALPPVFNPTPTNCVANGSKPRPGARPPLPPVHAMHLVAVVASFVLSVFALVFVLRDSGRARERRTQVAFGLALTSIVTVLILQVASPHVAIFDAALDFGAQRLFTPRSEGALNALTVAGSLPAVLVVAAMVAAWAWTRGERRSAVVLFGVAGAATLLVLFAHLLTGAFPSSHALVAAGVYGSCAIVVGRKVSVMTKPFRVFVPLLVVAIGVAQLARGTQWTSDVLVGLGVGALLCVLTATLTAGARPLKT